MPAATVFSQVKIAPPPPNFSGDLRDVFSLLETNLQVKNPAGYNTFVVGPNPPVTDNGPWLKDGTQWYVWDTNTFTYVPQVLVDAFTRDIPEGATLPASGTASRLFFLVYPPIGRVLFRWDGTVWTTVDQLAGNTAQRPTGPRGYTKYFDTDIGAALYFKPGFGWVTVDGIPGDIKFVSHGSLGTALQYNPGWVEYAPLRGRTVAGYNGGVNGLTDRAPGVAYGSEVHQITEAELPPHDHLFTHVGGITYQADNLVGQAPTPNSKMLGYHNDSDDQFNFKFHSHTDDDVVLDAMQVETVGGGFAHNNMQPTLFLIPLQKVQ